MDMKGPIGNKSDDLEAKPRLRCRFICPLKKNALDSDDFGRENLYLYKINTI